MKTPAFVHFEAQSHGFSTRCLRFKSYVTVCACKACFRLLARLYREGFDPSEFLLMVSVLTMTFSPYYDFPHFQAYPGATQPTRCVKKGIER